MSSPISPPSFVRLAIPNAVVSSLSKEEEAFFTVSLGIIGDTEARFEHLMPIPPYLAARIVEGLRVPGTYKALRHKKPVWAVMEEPTLIGLLKQGERLPQIHFAVDQQPDDFRTIYSGHINFQSGMFWFPGEPGATFLKAVRTFAKRFPVSIDNESSDTKRLRTLTLPYVVLRFELFDSSETRKTKTKEALPPSFP